MIRIQKIYSTTSILDLPITNLHLSITSPRTYKSFQELLTCNSPINDSIIHAYTSILTFQFPTVKTVDTNFSRDLFRFGWKESYKKYFLHSSSSKYAKRTRTKPTLDHPIILLPLHIMDSHWIALVHQRIDDLIHFFYLDDMNSSNTAHII
jgi:hypothetical protein